MFNGIISLISSSIGSSKRESCHQPEPLPSMIPFPWTVIPFSLVNSSHCKMPLPQELESVGAMIVPSSWENSIPSILCSRDQRMKQVQRGTWILQAQLSLTPQLYKQLPMLFQMPALHKYQISSVLSVEQWLYSWNYSWCGFLQKGIEHSVVHLWELGIITLVSSAVPSPLAPNSITLKTADCWLPKPLCGGVGVGAVSSLGVGPGGGGGKALLVGGAVGGGKGLCVGEGAFGFDTPFWWCWLLLLWVFPFFFASVAEVILFCLQCRPLLALQTSILDVQTRSATSRKNVRLLKLKPLIFIYQWEGKIRRGKKGKVCY